MNDSAFDKTMCWICDYWWVIVLVIIVIVVAFVTKDYWLPLLFAA